MRGHVVGLPERYETNRQSIESFTLGVTNVVCTSNQPCPQLNRIKLKWYNGKAVKPGDNWRLVVRLKKPWSMANPGASNYQTWLIANGYSAVGYVRSSSNNTYISATDLSVDRWRWKIAHWLDGRLADLPSLPIIKALLIGDKRGLSSAQWNEFNRVGVSHLMVISGLHVGLVSALVFLLFKVSFSSLSAVIPQLIVLAERYAAIFSILAAIVYSSLAGFSLPTQRALIMVVVWMLAKISQRHINPFTPLFISLLICLLLDPLAPTTASFWLSFVAVGCILFASTERFGGKNFYQSLFSPLIFFVGLFPVLALLLSQVSWISPFANSVMVPLYSLCIVPVNLLIAVIALVDTRWAVWLWSWLDCIIVASEQLISWFAGWSGAVSVVSSHSVTVYILAIIGSCLLLLPHGLPFKWLGGIGVLLLLTTQSNDLSYGDLRVSVLDVGQGLSVVVQTQEHVLVFDTGGSSGNFSAAQSSLLPYLNHNGVSEVDVLVVSHNDNDHAGGVPLIKESMPIGQIYRGEFLWGGSDNNEELCHKGQSWQWSGVTFKFLFLSNAADTVKSNNRSCVLMVSNGDHQFLLPGDIEWQVERDLLTSDQ
ncbi:DNA internalization-related competence protein ComEC/Rec2, partial [bacterium]|nr:DNA internalization-related competence protein ComEC/Rec2 [bacterium]